MHERMKTIYTTMTLDRPAGEIEVQLVGTFHPARRGTRAHPMDRFALPDEPAEISDICAATAAGEIELTEAELVTAEEKLMEALEE